MSTKPRCRGPQYLLTRLKDLPDHMRAYAAKLKMAHAEALAERRKADCDYWRRLCSQMDSEIDCLKKERDLLVEYFNDAVVDAKHIGWQLAFDKLVKRAESIPGTPDYQQIYRRSKK